MAAFTGDKSKVQQVNPGQFLDTSSGHYYTGSWDDAQDWGTDANNIGKTPAVQGYPTPPPSQPANTPAVQPPTRSVDAGTSGPAPTAAYLHSLITGGMDPQAAIAQFNKETGRTTGNEAVYYGPEVHGKPTIGLPDSYLSLESNGWGITQRPQGGDPGPQSGAGGMNYDQALAAVQKAIGRTLSPSEINAAFAKFGGTRADTFTQAGLNPVIDYFKTQGQPGPTGPTGGPPPPFAPNSTSTAPGPPNGIQGQLYQMLLNRAQQGTAVNPNDPNIRQQVDPYSASIERERRNYLADTAERSGPMANLHGEERLSRERAGQATGTFESQLIGREIQSKRDEIQSALSQLGSQLTADQQLALQKELGYLDDATKRYGINADYSLGQGRLGLDTTLGMGNLALGQGRLGLDTTLGMGNLALGQGRLGLDRDLGLGNLLLGRDKLGLDKNYYNWTTDPRNPANFPKG